MNARKAAFHECALRGAAQGTLLGLLAALAACGSGGGQQVPPPAPAVDSTRMLQTNQRIRAAAVSRATVPDTAGAYRIGRGDRLGVQVYGADTFTGDYQVEQNGVITLPLLGQVRAVGRTPRELEQELEQSLRSTYMRDPHVTVRVTEMLSHGVSVIGAVQQPGVYQVPGSSSVLEVLAMAQGLTPEAGNTVYVMRRADGAAAGVPVADSTMPAALEATPAALPNDLPAPSEDPVVLDSLAEQVIEVDLGVLLESGRSEENILLYPGDVIHVQSAGLVYVVGRVNRPGGFTVPPGEPMTALQALAMAEGLGSAADASKSVIVRRGPDGSRQEVPVDLEEVLEGSAPPPTLAARDVLFVPTNGEKAFALGVVNALVRMVTLRGLVY